MHNSVALIISVMLNLIGSFQFQDHTTLCKNRNPPTQRPWHSIETTRNKQEEKNQLGERQNENTNMDLKKKKKNHTSICIARAF